MHDVPVHSAADWLLAQRDSGNAIAAKALAGVLFALRATTVAVT